MAGFPCPYCAHVVAPQAQDDRLEHCPSCAANLQIAYRYRIIAARGKISSGLLYEAVDDIFGDKVAVLFAENVDDPAAVERFVEGNRLFAELGGGRGLVKVREVGNPHDRRPHVVIDWLEQSTLEQVVRAHGPVDQTTMLELIGDLLIGLVKAHRSMPIVVHGCIHPGTIGFLEKHRVVLFGFERAQHVYEQDSNLADTFIAQPETHAGASRASDLMQLGVSIHYAATGEWIADKPLAQQREHVQSKLGGPLAVVVDRMLTAGGDGYRSAVEAVLDFDSVLEGTSTWKSRPRAREQDRSSDLATTSWTSVQAPGSQEAWTDHADDHDQHDDHDEDHDEPAELPDLSDAIQDIFASEQSQPRAPTPPSAPPQPAFPSAHVPRRQKMHAQAAPAPKPAQSSPGRVIAIIVGSMVVFGTCMAAIVEDTASTPPPPPPVMRSEFQPAPIPSEVPPLPEYALPAETSFIDVQHYTGTITGPVDLAGFEVGERCDVYIAPTASAPNCRWYIDCGEPRKRIYGGGGVGYSDCTIENGRPTSASDDDQDAPDGSFVGLLTGEDPMVLVEDRWLLPPTRVMIGLDVGGGPYPSAVPDVPLAARMDRSEIEAAILRNELPEIEGATEELPDKLSTAQVRKIMDSRKHELRQCPVGDDVKSVKIKVTLLSSGHVDELEITPAVDEEAERCIGDLLFATRFPPFSGFSMTFTWPLRF